MPINSLIWSFTAAVTNDLLPYEYIWHKKKQTRRPFEQECEVTMFPQTWSSGSAGFDGPSGQAITTQYTVVVEGPMGDVCVYFGRRLAYHILRPNETFNEDVMKRWLAKASLGVKTYERVDAGK